MAHFIGKAVNRVRYNKVFRESRREQIVGKSAEGEVEKQSAVTETRGNEMKKHNNRQC